MALVGLVRVSTKAQDIAPQHDALDPICVKVVEEKVSGSLKRENRPGLSAAIDYMRECDMLAAQEVDRLGRNLIEGLVALTDLFERGIAVKVMDGIAKGEHTEQSFMLDMTMAMVLAEDRRRDIVRKTKNGFEAARKRGRVGGRLRVIDDDKRAVVISRREKGETIREIAPAVGVSARTVHSALAVYKQEAS